MATITIDLTTTAKTRVINAYGYGYTTTIIGPDGKEIPNPQTKTQFALDNFKRDVKNKVISVEAQIARDALSQPADIELTLS